MLKHFRKVSGLSLNKPQKGTKISLIKTEVTVLSTIDEALKSLKPSYNAVVGRAQMFITVLLCDLSVRPLPFIVQELSFCLALPPGDYHNLP